LTRRLPHVLGLAFFFGLAFAGGARFPAPENVWLDGAP
jgi:hypothetical protein